MILERVRMLNSLNEISAIYLFFGEINTRFLHFVKFQIENNPHFSKAILIEDGSSLKKCDAIFALDYSLPFFGGKSFFETHTPYSDNIRTSLKGRDSVIVPSKAHGESLRAEGYLGTIDVIENQVEFGWWAEYQPISMISQSIPEVLNHLIIFSRLDDLKFYHKNYLVRLLELNPELQVIQAGKFGRELLGKIGFMGIPLNVLNRFHFLGEIDFATNDFLFKYLAVQKGRVFHISLSNRESFNLSAHQAKLSGIPILTPDDPISMALNPDFCFTTDKDIQLEEKYSFPNLTEISFTPHTARIIEERNTFLGFVKRNLFFSS